MWSKIPRVGIDLRCLANSEKSGVENYVYDLAIGLPKASNEITFYYYFDARVKAKELQAFARKNVRIVRVPTKRAKIFTFALRILAALQRLDLFHFPLSIIPRYFFVPSLITVYDLTYERYPEFYSQESLRLQKALVPDSAKRAVGVFTISESTKNDLIEFYSLETNKIAVTYPNVRPALNQQKLESPYGYRFILCVGNIQPRKNIPNAIRAYASAKTDIRLVIVGRVQDPSESAIITNLINELGIGEKVVITGFVDDQKLSALYQNCEFVLFPSFYEGFGYPILEAFAYGKAVLTSKVSSMPELAGDGAVQVDPTNPEEISEGITKLLSPEVRKATALQGSKRLAELQKLSCAKSTVTAYLGFLKRSNGKMQGK